MAKVEKLGTFINTVFFSLTESSEILISNSTFKGNANYDQKSDAINDAGKKITDGKMSSASLQDEKRYFHIAFSDYYAFKRGEQDQLIYKIENINGSYSISTGLYCGVINFGSKLPQLEIKTGYSDVFFKRILNFCCGIYADTNTSKTACESESIYSLLIQYLFLASLRKVAAKAIPKKYVYLHGRGYDIQGNVDIEEYINHDLLSSDKMITYRYPFRLEIQSVVDVLYVALKSCYINKKASILPNMHEFEHHLAELYSGIKPSKKTVSAALKDKCLNNSLYSDYKKPLEYAKILLDNNDLNSGVSKDMSGISGFLVDASFLWEMYLYNLMRLNLQDWNIDAQCEISFYNNAFYSKKNYPDFVLRNKQTGKIFILDAKFKRMKFDNLDVDNDDIRQLHSYSYYFSLTEGEKFSGAALIYPSKMFRPNDKNNIDDIFGIETAGCKFGVFEVKDPSAGESMAENEAVFLKELSSFLENL